MFFGAYVEHVVDVGDTTMRVLTTDLTPIDPGAGVLVHVRPENVTFVA
jgi:hypothetical protein